MKSGNVRKRIRRLPHDQWAVLIRDHHPGYTDWDTFEMNQDRLTRNTRPGPQRSTRRLRPIARPGQMRQMRAQTARLLSRQELDAGLLLWQ